MTAASSSTPTSSNEAFVLWCLIARMRSSPVTIRARRTGPALLRSSKPANCTASIRKPTSPTCSPSSSISGPPRASTSSCPGPGRPSARPINSRRDAPNRAAAPAQKIKSSRQSRAVRRPLTVNGVHRIEVRDDKGDLGEAILEVRYRRIRILPPVGKQKRYPALTLTVIHAQERGKPKNRKKIDWRLLTDLSVQSRKDAIEKLEWYAMRWKIEMFHKILKSGCRAEESRLRTAE